MSYPPDYDPYARQPDAYQDPYARVHDDAAGRVVPPGVAMLVVGMINLGLSLYLLAIGLVYTQMTPEQFEKIADAQNERMGRMRDANMPVETILAYTTYGTLGSGGITLLTSLIVLLGGVMMLMRRVYGLAVFSAILIAVPCVSPSACCLLGEGIGIWAMIVLFNPAVRATFR